MEIPGQMNVYEHGVKLPTGGHWVDLPDSPFQMMARDTDTLGVVHVRINPAYAEHWNEFKTMMESGD